MESKTSQKITRHVLNPQVYADIADLEADIVDLEAAIAALEAIPAGAAVEGDYTTWTIQAIYDTGVTFSTNDTVGIRDNGNVWWHDQSTPPSTVSIISPAAALLATIDGFMVSTNYGRRASLLDRYILWVEYDDGNLIAITVQEGITKLWRRVVNDDRGGYTLDASPLQGGSRGISPSGEWIVVYLKEAAPGNALIFIYQGS